jgi:hypothetical protein
MCRSHQYPTRTEPTPSSGCANAGGQYGLSKRAQSCAERVERWTPALGDIMATFSLVTAEKL